MRATQRGPIAEGKRFGHLVVIDIMTATEAGWPQDGTWCRVKCDCGTREMVRARHLRFRARQGANISCGCTAPRGVPQAALYRKAL